MRLVHPLFRCCNRAFMIYCCIILHLLYDCIMQVDVNWLLTMQLDYLPNFLVRCLQSSLQHPSCWTLEVSEIQA